MRQELCIIGGIAAILLGISSSAQAAAEKYTLDPEHTTVLFFIKHAGFSNMVGSFRTVDGMLMLDRGHPENSRVQIHLDPKSVQTSSNKLDYMLQGKKFFYTKKYPHIDFNGSKVKLTGKNTAEVTGNLSMLGALSPMTLNVTMNKEGDLFTQHRMGFSGNGALKRSDYGMLEYIPVVSDEVAIQVEAEFQRVELEDKKKPR